MITSIYASVLALLIVKLSLAVIKLRRKNRVSVGDGGNEELQLAIRAHANAVEYIPITLMLLLTLELNAAQKHFPYIGNNAGHWTNIACDGASVKRLTEKSVGHADNDLSANWLGHIEYSILGICRVA